MRELGWVVAVSATAIVVGFSAMSTTPVAPAQTARDPSADLDALEATVSLDPTNLAALTALTEAYLARGAPGLAAAALDRAPLVVRERARVLDLRARALSDLGLAPVALETQRKALAACSVEVCSRLVLVRGERRARFLEEMVRLGVEDANADPAGALTAYRLAVREVRLEIATQ